MRAYSLMGKDNWLNRQRFRMVTKFIPNSSTQRLLDFGCGHGLFLKQLRSNTTLSLHGYDPYMCDSLDPVQQDGIKLYKSFETIEGNFDIITALDVIEHIEDHEKALLNINKLLHSNGKLLLTLPSYQWLYSLHDELIGHYRRYTKVSIRELLEKTGFTVVHQEYFFIFLIPVSVMMNFYLSARKLMKKRLHFNDLPPDPLGIFSLLVRLENYLVQTGVNPPCGYSLLTCAYKR